MMGIDFNFYWLGLDRLHDGKWRWSPHSSTNTTFAGAIDDNPGWSRGLPSGSSEFGYEYCATSWMWHGHTPWKNSRMENLNDFPCHVPLQVLATRMRRATPSGEKFSSVALCEFDCAELKR